MQSFKYKMKEMSTNRNLFCKIPIEITIETAACHMIMNTSLKVKDNFTCLFITKTMETKTYRMVILSDQTFLYSRGLFVHFQI